MAGPYRRSSTPEQREKAAQSREVKLAELHQTLTEEVSALASGPQWRAWLQVAARFHNYRTGSVGIFEVRECCGSAP